MKMFTAIEEAEAAMKKAGDKHNIKERWAEKYQAYQASTMPSLKDREGLWAAFVQKDGRTSVSFHKTREAARQRAASHTKVMDMFCPVRTTVTQANSEKAERLLTGMKMMKQAGAVERKPRTKAAKLQQHSLAL